MNDIEEQVLPKKRGRPRKNFPKPPTEDEAVKEVVKRKANPPQVIEGKVASGDVQKSLNSVLRWYGRELVRTDDECEERLMEFFTTLAENGELPSVEKMALCLGTTRRTIWEWEHGVYGSPRRQAMIKQAKEMLAAMDADLVSQNKIPVVSYIFRAKNFHDMTDKTEVVVTPSNPIGANIPEDELRKRIESDVVVDADEVGVEFADK